MTARRSQWENIMGNKGGSSNGLQQKPGFHIGFLSHWLIIMILNVC